jgi:uncharacterized phage protein (TIGR02216 family)
MAFGLGRLRLPPEAFWALTPRELGAAARPHDPAGPPLRRSDLAALAARYPDEVPADGR